MNKRIFQIVVFTTMIVSLGSMNTISAVSFSANPDMPKKSKCSGGYISCLLAKKECTWWNPKKEGFFPDKSGCITNGEATKLRKNKPIKDAF